MRTKLPISVVIPAYNATHFVPSAVATVRAQSVDVEAIIVVDDGSTDDTATVAESLGVRVLREPHAGQSATRNAGIAAATTSWVAILDVDDLWHPKKLELQFDAIRADGTLGLIFSDFDAVSFTDGHLHEGGVISGDAAFRILKRTCLTDHASLLDAEDFLVHFAARSVVLPSTSLFRSDLAREIGGFSLEIREGENIEFFYRLASVSTTAYVDLPLVVYMRRETQVSAKLGTRSD